MSRVTVLGAGFGALTAIRTLRRLDPALEIDVIAPQPRFVFYPATIWIPTGVAAPEQFEIPLERFFTRMHVTFHPGRATALEDGGRLTCIDDGQHNRRIENDGLIIATGSAFRRDVPGLEHAFLPCGGVAEMTRLRERLNELEHGMLAFGLGDNPDEPAAVRAGPLFELLFGIETWLRRRRCRADFRIVLFAPTDTPGSKLGTRAVERMLAEMRARGIEIRLNERARRFEPGRVVTDRDEFDADVCVFMPGLSGAPWLADTLLPRSAGGLVRADATCRVEGLERVFVVGDAGSFPGPDWAPKHAHNADLQAEAAARNLVGEFAGQPAKHEPKMELMAVLDMQDKAMLIQRRGDSTRVLPTFIGFHFAKRMFAWNYVRKYRR